MRYIHNDNNMNSLHRLFFFSMFIFLISCGSTKEVAQKKIRKETKAEDKIEVLISQVNKYEGTKYNYGGNSKSGGFDCSGLTQNLYELIDINLPHSAKLQAELGHSVKIKKAKKGDLVFFRNKGKVSHVAMIYSVNRDKVIIAHSTSTKGVIFEDLLKSKYWMDRLAFIKRII